MRLLAKFLATVMCLSGMCGGVVVFVGAACFWVSSYSCISDSGIPIGDIGFEIDGLGFCTLPRMPKELWGSSGHACPIATDDDTLQYFDDVQILLLVVSDKCGLQERLHDMGFLPVHNSNVTSVCKYGKGTKIESLSLMHADSSLMQLDSPAEALPLVRLLCDQACGLVMWSMKGSDTCSAVRSGIIVVGMCCVACVVIIFLNVLAGICSDHEAIYRCFREREDTMMAGTRRRGVDTSRLAYVSDGAIATFDTDLGRRSLARVVARQLAQQSMRIELDSPIELVEPVFCAICLTETFDCIMIKLNQCGHAFHVECIIPWSSAAGTCPLCRSTAKTGHLLVARAELDPALQATDGLLFGLQDSANTGESSDSDGPILV